MLNILEDEKKELTEKYQADMEVADLYKPVLPIAVEYCLRFSKDNTCSYYKKTRRSELSFALGYGKINCLSINLILGEEDSIKDAMPIVENIMEHPRLKFEEETEYLEVGWRGWKFKYVPYESIKYNGHWPILMVRIFFENSKQCRLEGTGKYEEIKQLVCLD